MKRNVFSLGALVLVSCGGVSEEQWDDAVRDVSCQTVRRCDPITFHRDYGDLQTCIDATNPGNFAGCRYDESAARDCLAAFDWSCRRLGRDYDEWRARCSAVWTCDDDGTGDTGTVVPPL